MSAQHELEGSPSDAISAIRFSPSGRFFLVSSWDRSIQFYERQEDGTTTPFALDPNRTAQGAAPILDACWGKDDTTAYIVGLRRKVSMLQVDKATEGANDVTLSIHESTSNKVAYSREHGILLSTSWDGTMHVHDPESGKYYRVRLAGKPFALSLTAERAVVAMAERKVSVYNLVALKQLLDQTGGTAANQEILDMEPWQQRESSLKFMTRAVACMPDGTGFAISSIEGRVGVEWFDPERQQKTYAFKCHRQVVNNTDENGQDEELDVVYPVNALAFNSLYGTFATGGGDGAVALWDAKTKRRVRQYQKLNASVAALDFSPDGKFLAIGISPGFEDGKEDEEADGSLIKVIVRELADGEAKGKAAK